MILNFYSCIKFNSFNKETLIIETNFSGEGVVFADLSKDLLIQMSINKNWSRMNREKSIPYFKLKNNSGLIKGIFTYNAASYLIVQVKDGAMYKWEYDSIIDKSLPSHLATISAINDAESYIGKNIWLNQIYADSVFLNNSEKRFKKFDKVMVTGIKVFQNSKTGIPLWLEINTNSENNAFIRYNGKFKTEFQQNNYYNENPLKKKWPLTIIESLKKKRIDFGMSCDQVRVSIGNPIMINNTSSIHGVSQQWIYGKNINEKKYLLFKNGKLVSM